MSIEDSVRCVDKGRVGRRSPNLRQEVPHDEFGMFVCLFVRVPRPRAKSLLVICPMDPTEVFFKEVTLSRSSKFLHYLSLTINL